MFNSPILNWYTDLLTVYRSESYTDGSLTKQKRVEIANSIPCRVYRKANASTNMKETAAQVSYNDMLACDNGVDVKAGDELVIIHGGVLGYAKEPVKYFAGEPVPYYEPFGGIVPNIAHQQIPLTNDKRN